MPEWDNDENEETPLVKQLRKQIEGLTKSKTEAEAGRAAAEGKLTERVLSETLTAKGVNPKAAKFLVKDGVDATDETAVAAWLEENSDLFPATTPAAAQATEDEQEQVDEQVVHGYQQLSGMSAMQRPADMNKLTEVERTLSDDATPAQVAAAFRKAGL